MYIQGALEARSGSRRVMAVPDEAVQTIGGEPAVFVLEAGDRFIVRPVELGEKIGANRAIIRGLTGSEQVAVTGTFTLKSELMKGSLGEGH
jgi:cobalt-zinc-cadmium efflux system membrane fusion protein